jgi:uncharacterized iron-regulated membrane protein
MRQERLQRESLDLQRRQTAALEHQARGHNGVVGLLLLVAIVVGIVWAVMWFCQVVWRVTGGRRNSPHTPTDPKERDLIDLLRRHDIDLNLIKAAVEQTLRKHGG